jgi:hypothetical protein
MPRMVRSFGLWAIHAPRGAQDKRVFSEARNGDWPVSLFQRAVGVRLFSQSVYRRSFARMGEWKGFFMTQGKGAARSRLQPLLRSVREHLEAPCARARVERGASKALAGARGHVALWAPRMKFLRAPPCGKLLARIYVKRRGNSAA